MHGRVVETPPPKKNVAQNIRSSNQESGPGTCEDETGVLTLWSLKLVQIIIEFMSKWSWRWFTRRNASIREFKRICWDRYGSQSQCQSYFTTSGFDHESCGTRNRESLCWRGPAAKLAVSQCIPSYIHILKIHKLANRLHKTRTDKDHDRKCSVETKKMVVSLKGLVAKTNWFMMGLSLQFLLTLASAVILRSESRRTHDHSLLSQIPAPPPADPRGAGRRPGTGGPVRGLRQLAGIRWRYSTPPPQYV
jgi:hypothetical protein